MMDLISREALKNDLKQYFTDGVLDGVSAKLAFNQILHDIDNAPTVEPEVKKVPIANVTFDTEKLKELTDEIVDRIKNGEIVLQAERPQGEWIIHNSFDGWVECPFCHVGRTVFEKLPKFCENCGADMRGGAV